MQRNTLFSEFVKAEDDRTKLKLTARIDELLEFEETVLRKDYDKVSKDKSKGKRRREYLTQQYEEAFVALSRQEKVDSYKLQVEMLTKLLNGTFEPFDANSSGKETEVSIKGYIRGWNKKILRVNRRELCIELARPGKVKKHDLYNYIYRKSKNSEYFSFVLESINAVPKSKYKTIHLGFTNINTYNEWFDEVKAAVDFARAKTWAQDLGVQIPIKNESVGPVKEQPKQVVVPPKEEVPKPVQSAQEAKTVVNTNKPVQATIVVAPEKKIEPTKPSSTKEISTEVKQSTVTTNSTTSNPSTEPEQANTLEKKASNLVDRIIKEQIQAGELENLPTQYDELPQGKKPNLLEQILPEYQLDLLGSDDSYKTLQYENKYRLLQSTTDPQNFKIFMNFSFPAEVVFFYITNLQTFRNWNTEVDEIAVKTLIASENTAILYLKIKAFSRIYRPRDFVFLRHAFRRSSDIYLIDKSIENVNYPPFLTIVRGKLETVWGFLPNADNTECLLVIDCKLDHQGYINEDQNTNLSVQYLKKLLNIQSYIVQKSFKKEDSLNGMFDVGPPPAQSEDRKSPNRPKLSTEILKEPTEELDRMKSFKNKDSWSSKTNGEDKQQPSSEAAKVELSKKPVEEDKGEIPLEELNQQPMSNTMRVPELDSEGLSIINQSYISTKFKMVPWDRELIPETNFINHHIWRDEWKVDTEAGGCWFVNQQKMAEQRKVFSYILSKMGKNLLSGKGILNISLPVDVFSMESNLEALAKSFAFSPILLEKAAALKEPLEQMKYVIAFGFTLSLLYIKMEKPFNPILGETLQCSFKGCPLYLEQVSHHPPIASLYMIGRGYRMYGSIESKMDLSINSGTGYNAGDVVVRFDNGTEVRLRTPGGEISGLTYGERKLLMNNKSFYWEPNLGYMLDINFNPGKKGFWSMSKQQTPADYFEGTMKRVRKDFIQQFQEKKSVFKPSPSSKDVIEQYYKVTGQWTKEVLIDDKVFYNVENDRYAKYEVEPNPLPSDCMYREDVVYKRLGNISRSQNQKQRLEILQRKDKKLREKKK